MTKFHLFSQDSVRLETAPTGECVSPMFIERLCKHSYPTRVKKHKALKGSRSDR